MFLDEKPPEHIELASPCMASKKITDSKHVSFAPGCKHHLRSPAWPNVQPSGLLAPIVLSVWQLLVAEAIEALHFAPHTADDFGG